MGVIANHSHPQRERRIGYFYTNGSEANHAESSTGKFNADDIFAAWRGANSVDGKLYGMPYDGEVTIQVYRKDLYQAKGLKAADTLEDYMKNAAAVHAPNDRIWGAALRGVAGAGQEISTRPFQLVTGRKWEGSAFGGARGRTDVPKIVDWYMEGKINIDDLITHTMPLEDINKGFDLMKRGESIRGVVIY